MQMQTQTAAAFPIEPRDYSRRSDAKARAMRLRNSRRAKSAAAFLAIAFGA